ncbi:MAG: BTAD domain-containing putative transcriptional regulator [Acidimicrobiales bacterium]
MTAPDCELMLEISLIGSPSLADDGGVLDGPRGRKAWALLGRLARSDDPPSRRRLVDELFVEAADPMGALRWNLAELRRTLGLADSFKGDPVHLQLPATVTVDARSIDEQISKGKVPAGDFLEGIDVSASPEFETWLLIERQRVDAEVLAAAHHGALRALSIDQHDRAIDLGYAAVRRAPLDEGSHVLLVKALAASGDTARAEEQVAACRRTFMDDLGIEPGPSVAAAARPSVADPIPGVSARASARSLLDAGLAALAAGAADAGIECLRRAVADADGSGDEQLRASTRFELGTALVHAVRGYDDEGAVVLMSALETAKQAGDSVTASKALTELAYVDMVAGRRANASKSLDEGEALAAGDPLLLAAIAGFSGMNLNDWGRPTQAVEFFERSLHWSREAGSLRREGWSTGLGAVALLSVGRIDDAREWLERSLAVCEIERWTAFRPWPAAWLGKIRLLDGVPAVTVREDMETNLALSNQLGDPCWQGVSAETIGLTYREEGDLDSALEWMARARGLCNRVSDRYVWFSSQTLRAEAETAIEAGATDRAAALADQLIIDAARGQMDGLLEDGLRIRAGLLER